MRAQVAPPTDTLDPKKLLKVLSDYKRGDFSARLPTQPPAPREVPPSGSPALLGADLL